MILITFLEAFWQRAGSIEYERWAVRLIIKDNETIFWPYIGGFRIAGDRPKRFQSAGLQYHLWRWTRVLRIVLRRRLLLSGILLLP
jgi:hypothetical protein